MQGAFASRFNVPAQLLAPIPDGVSAVEAATIPAAAHGGPARIRLGAAQARRPGAHSRRRQGVGLAAIQMAQHCGATVFATASTFKRATHWKMGVEYVYDSAQRISPTRSGRHRRLGCGRVVLNSLTSGGFSRGAVQATAQNGRFLEILKRDIWTPEQMAATRPDIAYEIVALGHGDHPEPERIRRLPTEVSEGLAWLWPNGCRCPPRSIRSGGQGGVSPDAAGAPHRQDRVPDTEPPAAAGPIGPI